MAKEIRKDSGRSDPEEAAKGLPGGHYIGTVAQRPSRDIALP